MTSRNAVILLLASLLSLLCYHRASHNRYATAVAEAMGEIDTNFVQPIDHRDLFEGSLRGMTRSLDDYSGYVDPDQYDQLLEDIDQRFGGVGIVVDIDKRSERLMVVTPVLDTPASEAGLRAGDLIMAIDGTDTEGLTAADTVTLIRGEPDTDVTLTIQSPDEPEEKDVVLKRAIIPVQSVLGDRRRADGSWTFVLEDEPDIGYIRLVSFGENSARDLRAAIEEVLPNVKSLILDLRGNGGGLLDAAVEICDMFVDDGTIVSVKGRDTLDQREYRAGPSLLVPPELPMVVLVDHFSASASEITSACLQDHKRATVIGERTWGKGTVQSLIELEGGRSALRLTTATYWRPSGRNIHRLAKTKPEDDWGVTPDPEFTIDYDLEQRRDVMVARRKRDGDVLKTDDDAKDEVATEEESEEESEDEDPKDEAAEDESPDESTEDAKDEEKPVVDSQLNLAIEHLQSLMKGPVEAESEPLQKAA